MTFREKRPPCYAAHKSWWMLARCVFGGYAAIQGEGPWALINEPTPYRRRLVRLYPNREMAEAEMSLPDHGARSLRELYPHHGCAAPGQAA